MPQRKYDSTVARIAGNIATTIPVDDWRANPKAWALELVEFAREIVQATKDTEPKDSTSDG